MNTMVEIIRGVGTPFIVPVREALKQGNVAAKITIFLNGFGYFPFVGVGPGIVHAMMASNSLTQDSESLTLQRSKAISYFARSVLEISGNGPACLFLDVAATAVNECVASIVGESWGNLTV